MVINLLPLSRVFEEIIFEHLLFVKEGTVLNSGESTTNRMPCLISNNGLTGEKVIL